MFYRNPVIDTYSEIIDQIQSRADAPAKERSFRRFCDVALPLVKAIDPTRVILVAGTNGKGSIAKTLELLFSRNGETVGLFTSPHLIQTTERIRTGGLDLSKREFVEAFSKVEDLWRTHGLSHFETLTLMMIETFFGNRIRPAVERAIIEVGVGGALDPTRLLPHATTVISRLGLDHQAILGNSLEEIARHKFGAVDPGNLVVHAPFPKSIAALAQEAAIRTKSRWIEAGPRPYTIEKGPTPKWKIDGVALGLPGRRAVENVSVALRTVEEMGFRADLSSLATLEWPGRMELFEVHGRRVYLSGDHNPQGIESLLEILSAHTFRKLLAIVGVGQNKDAGAILQTLMSAGWGDRLELILTRTPFRGADLSIFGSTPALAREESPERALRIALRHASENDLIIVTGSLYLVGALRARLKS